jgi:hypothetical protein
MKLNVRQHIFSISILGRFHVSHLLRLLRFCLHTARLAFAISRSLQPVPGQYFDFFVVSPCPLAHLFGTSRINAHPCGYYCILCCISIVFGIAWVVIVTNCAVSHCLAHAWIISSPFNGLFTLRHVSWLGGWSGGGYRYWVVWCCCLLSLRCGLFTPFLLLTTFSPFQLFGLEDLHPCC